MFKQNRGNKKFGLSELKDKYKKDHYYNHPNDFGEEGDDHVLISVYSTSIIGKVFAPEYSRTISYPHLGKFASVSNLWFWLRDWKPNSSPNDMIRNMKTKKLRAHMKNERRGGSYVKNFKSIIGLATWLKIKQLPNVLREIKEFDESKKLLVYSTVRGDDNTYSNLRVMSSHADFLIDIAYKIIDAVKAGVEPNFDDFADTPDNPSGEAMLGYYLDSFIKGVVSTERYESMCGIVHGNDALDQDDNQYELEEYRDEEDDSPVEVVGEILDKQ